MKRRTLYITLFIVTFLQFSAISATCTFTGNGDGTSWSDDNNWSCGSVPDPSSDHVIIPSGYNVTNDDKDDFGFENGNDITINGSLDMENKKIEIKASNSFFLLSSTGTLSDTKELVFNSGGGGTIESGASLTAKQLKIDDNSSVEVNARPINITQKFEVLSSGAITGSGLINYTGSSGNYTMSSSNGVFGCTDSDFGDCDLDGNVILPVELISFELETSNEGIKIFWTTATETNNDHFEIERLKPDGTWKRVGTVLGNGNSQSSLSYNFSDSTALNGKNTYRLKQIDFDGASTTYTPKSIQFSNNKTISVFPNPAYHQITIQTSDLTPLRIFSLDGKKVLESSKTLNRKNTTTKINISSLPNGVYYVKVGTKTLRFLKR